MKNKNQKPIIGIVAKYRATKNDRYDALIRDEVKNAIIDNGGIAIDNPTNNYVVAAVGDDGNPDVLEAPNKKFNFAIRFHPESLYRTHPEHNAIFRAMIEACR